MAAPKCDYTNECEREVSHLDIKGFTYCAGHSARMAGAMPIRKLTKAELARLQNGLTISWKREKGN